MSKDIATAMIRMLEYGKAMSKPPKPKKAKRKTEFNDMPVLDYIGIVESKRRELQALESFLKDQEKIYKKEEKKDDKKEEKKGWDASTIALWLMLLFPITGPLYWKFLTVTLGLK